MADPVDTIPSVTGRRFEATVDLAIRAARQAEGPVILVFADIAVQVDPGDDAATIARNYDETAALVGARLRDLPLLTGRTPDRGDILETLVDDHSTKIMKGSAGVITEIERNHQNEVHKVVVRFGRRTVDYVPEDFAQLRYVR